MEVHHLRPIRRAALYKIRNAVRLPIRETYKTNKGSTKKKNPSLHKAKRLNIKKHTSAIAAGLNSGAARPGFRVRCISLHLGKQAKKH